MNHCFCVCQLTVRKHRSLVCFGLMHVLATNMCIWLRVLVFEVLEAIKHGEVHHGSSVMDHVAGERLDGSLPLSKILVLVGGMKERSLLRWQLKRLGGFSINSSITEIEPFVKTMVMILL